MLFFLVFSSTVELKAGSLNKLEKYFARAIPTVCETILDAFPREPFGCVSLGQQQIVWFLFFYACTFQGA